MVSRCFSGVQVRCSFHGRTGAQRGDCALSHLLFSTSGQIIASASTSSLNFLCVFSSLPFDKVPDVTLTQGWFTATLCDSCWAGRASVFNVFLFPPGNGYLPSAGMHRMSLGPGAPRQAFSQTQHQIQICLELNFRNPKGIWTSRNPYFAPQSAVFRDRMFVSLHLTDCARRASVIREAVSSRQTVLT